MVLAFFWPWNGLKIRAGRTRNRIVSKKLLPDWPQNSRPCFPRLAICICADGLYPNNTFFTICRAYEWNYIVTLEDGNLKTFCQTIPPLNKECKESRGGKGSYDYIQQFQWLIQIDLKGFTYNWLQLNEQVVGQSAKSKSERKFAYLTDFPLTEENIGLISDWGACAGRLKTKDLTGRKIMATTFAINIAVTLTGDEKLLPVLPYGSYDQSTCSTNL